MFRCKKCGLFTDLSYCDKCNVSDTSPFFLTLARKSASGIIKSSLHWTKAFRRRFVQYTDEELAVILFNDNSLSAISMVKEARAVLETRYWYPVTRKREVLPGYKQDIRDYFASNVGNLFFAQTGGTTSEPAVFTYRLKVLSSKATSARLWVEVLDKASDSGYTPLGIETVFYTDIGSVSDVIMKAVQNFTKSDNIRLHIL